MPASDFAPRLCVVGSVNIDTFVASPTLPRPGETVLGISQVHTPGGKGANQAVAAGLLGTHTTFVGAVGDDDAGRIVEATFRRFEIDATRLARSTAPTGAAIVCVAETGENAIIVISGANAAFGADDVRSSIEQIRSADAVVLQAEISLEANQAAVEVASKCGTPVIMNMAPVPRDINPYLPLLASCEVLILNEVEEAALVASGARLHTLGPELIVTTLGEHGVRWWHKGIQGSMEAINPAAAIIDTVGAGDAFVGAFANRWAAARVAGTPLDDVILRDMLRWGMAAGALACTKCGAIDSMPSRSDVVNLLRTRA